MALQMNKSLVVESMSLSEREEIDIKQNNSCDHPPTGWRELHNLPCGYSCLFGSSYTSPFHPALTPCGSLSATAFKIPRPSAQAGAVCVFLSRGPCSIPA
ncbi:unnamed protein product [Natator depressus]